METDNMRIPEEREIDLVDLMVSVLLHWRGMLVAILVGAIALGAYSYVKTAKEAANVTEEDVNQQELALQAEDEEKAETEELQALLLEDEIDTEAVEELMDENELQNVKDAVEYQKLYEIRKQRVENSAIMKIDPMHVYQTDMMFSIEADSSKVYALGSVYETAIGSNELCEYIQEKCDIEEDLEDVIGLRSGTKSQNSAVTDTDVYTFGIYIQYYDEDTCSEMADAVIDYLNEQQTELSGTMYEHTLNLVSRTAADVVDNSFTDDQWSMISGLSSMKSTVTGMQAEFSIAGNMYFDYLTTGEIDKEAYEKEIALAKEAEEAAEEEEDTTATTIVEPAHVEAKYVLVGAFLFVCLYAGFYAVLYIFNNRLKETDNFQELYGLSQLAYISDGSKKKGRTIIDRWLLKLRRKGAGNVSLEESVELAAVAVKMMAQRFELKQVCLAGSKLDGVTAEICQQISEFLAKDGISAECLNNVLGNPEMMQRLDQTKGVVLVETTGISGYKDIENELLLMVRQNITVLGGIIVGNN